MPVFTPLFNVSEEIGTREEVHNVEGQGFANVVVRCPYNVAQSVVADILLNRRVWPFTPAGFAGPRAVTAAIVPDSHCEGMRIFNQGYLYGEALIRLGYSTAAEVDLVAESFEPSSKFVTLDHRRFRWGSGTGEPILEDEAPGFQYAIGKLSRTIFDVEPPLPVSLLNLQGSCNSGAYTSDLLGLTFGPETLLYQAPVMSRTITTQGAQGWDLRFEMPYTQVGWNTYWRGDTQQWSEIYFAGGDTPIKPYPPGNFSAFLF